MKLLFNFFSATKKVLCIQRKRVCSTFDVHEEGRTYIQHIRNWVIKPGLQCDISINISISITKFTHVA